MPGQLSFTAQSLYMALLHVANETYSCNITPSNPLLMAKTGIRDVKTLDKARKELIEINLIEYTDNAKSRLAGKYHIIGLEVLLVDNFQKNTGKIPEDTPENFLGSPGKKPPHIQEENIGEEIIDIPLPPAEDEQEIEPPLDPPKKPEKVFAPESQEYVLSQYLLDKILSNNPDNKLPDLNKWAKNMDLILRVDARAPDEVRVVIDYCQSDTFWKCNILSVNKLREKYDQLNIKRKEACKNGSSSTIPRSSTKPIYPESAREDESYWRASGSP